METTTENISITIPKRAIRSLAGLVLLLGFTCVQFQWLSAGVSGFRSIPVEELTLVDTGAWWYLGIGYLLISCNILLAVNVFKKLRPFKESGLVNGLVGGFILGLVGLLFDLILGFIGSFYADSIPPLIVFSFWGLAWGLITGLITLGLIWGLAKEFSK